MKPDALSSCLAHDLRAMQVMLAFACAMTHMLACEFARPALQPCVLCAHVCMLQAC